MGESKQRQNGRLSYDELNRALSDLHIQYQKLTERYGKAMQALQDRNFSMLSFLLQALFKVMERPEMYDKEFVDWSQKNIQSALTAFAEDMAAPAEDAGKEDSGKGGGTEADGKEAAGK